LLLKFKVYTPKEIRMRQERCRSCPTFLFFIEFGIRLTDI